MASKKITFSFTFQNDRWISGTDKLMLAKYTVPTGIERLNQESMMFFNRLI